LYPSSKDFTVPTFIDAHDNALVTQATPSRTVLYVEDHPVNVLVMQALFAKRPELKLVVALDGGEALTLAGEEHPELLLLDLNLPDCHGADLLHRLREMPHLRDVPAVAVTAETVTDLTAQGFREIWHKPMDMRSTLMRLDWILAQPEIERMHAPASTSATWANPHRAARRQAPAPIPFPTSQVADAPLDVLSEVA
jgi:CheY-like chemotaxis protein